MRWASCILELLPKGAESFGILVIALYLTKKANQLFESDVIEATVFFQTVFRASTKLIKIPSSLGDADDRNIEMSPFHHRLQGRENLLVCKIAGGAEENQRVRVGICHECPLLQAASDFSAGFSKCPPNSKRIADS